MTSIQASVGRGGANIRSDVHAIQALLNSKNASLRPLAVDGIIGPKTIAAITSYQQNVVHGVVDGRVDPNGMTLRTLNHGSVVPPQVPTLPPAAPTTGFAAVFANIAEGEVGIMEGSANNTGVDILKYKQATWLAPGAWPWCAAFVCWCFREALAQQSVPGVSRPQTAGAWDFENWASSQSKATLHKPAGTVLKGDIVVFTFSHIGIAVANESGGTVRTVEGNTNVRGTRDGGGRTTDGVYRKSRAKGLIRSVIRIG